MTSERASPEGKEHGVDLDMLVYAINQTNLRAWRDNKGVGVQHELFGTRVSVLPPPHSVRDQIQAVVMVRTGIPEALASFFDSADAGSEFNRFASLGALTKSSDGYHVESRLTIFEDENAWTLHFPLLMFAAIAAAEAILGGVRRSFTGQGPKRDMKSRWQPIDFHAVKNRIQNFSVCNADDLGLSAEFGLEAGAISSVAGHKTALFQMVADQPHPEVGGGLFCMLSLPQRIDDKPRLLALVAELNRLEMQPGDQPPHFGAWCIGSAGNNAAYVSFFLNAMHSIDGLALNAAVWAMHRAKWADGQISRIMAPPSRPNTPPPPRTQPPLKPTAPQSSRVVPPVSMSEQCSSLVKRTFGIGLSKEKLLQIENHIRTVVPAGWSKRSSEEQALVVQAIRSAYPSVMHSEVERLIKVLDKNDFFR